MIWFFLFKSTILSALALSPQIPAEPIEDVKFKPHMIEHLIKGCPENSNCSKKTGEVSEKFKQTFSKGSPREKKNFVKKYGLPFTFWTQGPSQKDIITYQSRCLHHRPQKDKYGKVVVDRKEIYEGIRFTKNLKNIITTDGFTLNQMIKEGSKQKYFIPRSSIPYFTKGDTLYFRQEFREIDYTLQISPNKKTDDIYLSLVNMPFPKEEVLNTSCSPELIKKFQQLNQNNLYQSAYCKMIYDIKEKKYHRYIFGWSC